MNELAIKAFAKAIENSNEGHGFKPFSECANTYRVMNGAAQVSAIRQGEGFGDALAALMLVEADGSTVKGVSLSEYFDNAEGGEADERVWDVQISDEPGAGDGEEIYAEFTDYRCCLRAAGKNPADAFFARTLASAAANLQTALAQLPTSQAEKAALKLANEWFEAGRE